MTTNYFLPINSANISQYFSRGIIIPSTHIKGWINDIQTKYSNSILLCNKPLTSETDCSLTIVFSDDELNNIKVISENFFIFNKPLPISRIKSLNFRDEQQSKTTIYNIEKGDAFVPELVSIIDDKQIVEVSELDDLKNTKNTEESSEKMEIYNRILGGFSLMQIADFPNKVYPKNYFNSLAIINQEVKKQIADFSFSQDYSPYLLNFSSAIYGKINSDYVSKYAKEKEGFELPLKRGLIRLDQIDVNKNSYLLAILATYGDDTGKVKKNRDFIFSLINDKFNDKIKEVICLLFGINQGYSSFRNQYNIQGDTVNAKFKLDSELDYSIIESVYQYVFNNRKDNTNFPYINEWCPKFNNKIDFQRYKTYRIFDKDIVYKKKLRIGSTEYLQELYQKFWTNSGLSPIFNYFNESVTNSIETTIKTIFNKVKSDIEDEQKIKNELEINKLKEEVFNLKEQNEKLSNQKLQYSSEDYNKTNANESSSNLDLKTEIDKDTLIRKRLETLEKIKAIDKLKTIAKYSGIKSFSQFGGNEEDKKTLRNLIIEKEKELLNL